MASLHQTLIEKGFVVVNVVGRETEKDKGINPLARALSKVSLRVASGEYFDVAAMDAESALKGEEDLPNFIPREPVTLIYADINWNHERFISEGHSYVRSLYSNRQESNIVISERLSEQKQIVDDLVRCSKELSGFIKKHIGIEEFFGLTK